MEETHSENLQLGRLVADAVVEIERLGYSRRSRNRYRAIWQHLIEYSERNKLGDEFFGDLAVRFLEEQDVQDREVFIDPKASMEWLAKLLAWLEKPARAAGAIMLF